MSEFNIASIDIGGYEYLRFSVTLTREEAEMLHLDSSLVSRISQAAAAYVRDWDGVAPAFDGTVPPYTATVLISTSAREDIDYFAAITANHFDKLLSAGHPEFVDADL